MDEPASHAAGHRGRRSRGGTTSGTADLEREVAFDRGDERAGERAAPLAAPAVGVTGSDEQRAEPGRELGDEARVERAHVGLGDGLGADQRPARGRVGVVVGAAREERVDERVERRALAPVGGGDPRFDPRPRRRHQPVDERPEDLGLVGEVIVDEPRREPSLPRDLGDGGPRVTEPRHRPPKPDDDLRASLFGVRRPSH